MKDNPRKIIYSGIQPTGCVTIGNYIGAIKNWKTLQESSDCIFGIANMHALTVRQQPEEFRARVKSFFAQYLACGLDPIKSILYIQSDVCEHAELTWILNCYTYMGELSRMVQYKDKSAKNEDNINSGLFTYPILMAADILLYKTNLVPVGADQKQHLELARDIAIRFNNLYGDVFAIPEPYIPEQGAKITSLQKPLEKMSKTDSDPNGMVSIIDTPDIIRKKFRRAVTDSDTKIIASPDKPGVTNLLTIYAAFSDCSIQSAEQYFASKGYGDLKREVADVVIESLLPIQDKYNDLMKNKDYLEKVAKEGAERARIIAQKTLNKVKRKIGFR